MSLDRGAEQASQIVADQRLFDNMTDARALGRPDVVEFRLQNR